MTHFLLRLTFVLVVAGCPTQFDCDSTCVRSSCLITSHFMSLPPEGDTSDLTCLHVTKATNHADKKNSAFTLRSTTFEKLPSLKCLDISLGHLLLDKSPFIFLERLVYLKLTKNALTSISQLSFTGLRHLSCLDLSHNLILEVADGSLQLDTLKYLSLAFNRLSSLSPAVFTRLSNLKVLKLDGNHLGLFHPLTFVHLPNLQVLSLCGCQLRTLPPRLLRYSSNLTRLYLQNNKLSHIPSDVIFRSQHLQEVYLDNNHIREIRNKRLANFSLKVLSLSNNNISSIHQGALKDTRIYVINLENNNIQSLSPGTFHPHLVSLSLAGNSLHGAINISGLPNLQVLNLTHNNLSEISELMENSTALTTVDFSYNNLTNFTSSSRRLWKQLKIGLLQGNPLLCDCGVSEFINWIHSGDYIPTMCIGSQYLECLKCARPAQLAGTLLMHLTVTSARPCAINKRDNGIKQMFVVIVVLLVLIIIFLVRLVCVYHTDNINTERAHQRAQAAVKWSALSSSRRLSHPTQSSPAFSEAISLASGGTTCLLTCHSSNGKVTKLGYEPISSDRNPTCLPSTNHHIDSERQAYQEAHDSTVCKNSKTRTICKWRERLYTIKEKTERAASSDNKPRTPTALYKKVKVVYEQNKNKGPDIHAV